MYKKTLKVIITGSRTITDYSDVHNAMEFSKFIPTEIVSGGAYGVDSLGEKWAVAQNTKVTKFNADWDQYGKDAGPIRNKQIADYADALVAIWDGESRGTLNMINEAHKNGLKIFIYMPSPNKYTI